MMRRIPVSGGKAIDGLIAHGSLRAITPVHRSDGRRSAGRKVRNHLRYNVSGRAPVDAGNGLLPHREIPAR